MRVLVALAFLAQASPPESEAEKALRWFAGEDAELRESARVKLVSIGRDAAPAIEKRLKEKGVLELANLLREIDRAGDGKAVTAADLPTDEDVLKELPKPEKGLADRYVYTKYAEALAWARKGQFQKGYDLARAMETLEPKGTYADKVRLLRRHCENMITQTTFLEATVVQPKLAFLPGEPIELALRLKSLWRSQVSVTYDKGGGLVVVEVEVVLTDIYGNRDVYTRHQELKVEAEIPIATGAQWELPFRLEGLPEIRNEQDVRVITVNAWTQPLRIEAEGQNFTRKLQFMPGVVKVAPAKYKAYLEDPLASLGKTIEENRPAEETWICAQLLDEARKDAGVARLIEAMGKTANPGYRGSIASILGNLTGEKLGLDPKKWDEWRAKRKAGK